MRAGANLHTRQRFSGRALAAAPDLRHCPCERGDGQAGPLRGSCP